MRLYTKRGLYHKNNNEPSGDVIRGVDHGDVAVLAVADGVSTCACGAEGASLVSTMALEYVQEQYALFHCLPGKWADRMLVSIQKQLGRFAEKQGTAWEEFSTTLMILLIDRKQELFYYCNIGDGLMLTIGKVGCPIISMPQGDADGCPVVTTAGVEKLIETGKRGLDGVNNILMCTDGAWRAMYKQSRLYPNVREQLVTGNFDQFERYLETSNAVDDCSFAVVDTRRSKW